MYLELSSGVGVPIFSETLTVYCLLVNVRWTEVTVRQLVLLLQYCRRSLTAGIALLSGPFYLYGVVC